MSVQLDEVDILMLDDTFGPQLRTIGQAAPVDQTQFVFCTATLPDAIVQKIQREFPNVQQIRGPGLHKVAPTVKERLVDVSVPAPHHRNPQMCFDVKAKALLQSLRETRCRRTLIFCNTVESCRQVENLLKRHDRQGQLYHVGAYHNALTPQARQANLRGLAREATSSDRDAILVCTDRAARGVDFGGMAVDHIVIFDFPADPAEYLRRVGRTARAGRVGTCTVLAYGWQLPTARSIMAHDGHSANGGGATTRAATLQEIRVADDGIVPDSSAVEGENDWSVGERRQKKKDAKKNGQKQKKDMKTSIERGQLWTDA
jgi:ATP-dependent RNA helicase DDX18/HAS1